MDANVFFRPLAPNAIAVALQDDDVLGVAQLLRAELRPVVGNGAGGGRPVAFVQSVSVAPAARRSGVARALMTFCEDTVRDTWTGADAVDEAWLAVATENIAALSLYESMGYTQFNKVMGNNLLSKPLAREAKGARSSRIVACELPMDDAAGDEPVVPITGGVGWGPLASNLGVQALYVGVAALGISFLLAPFGGPSALGMVGLDSAWQPYAGGLVPATPIAFISPIGEVALGLGVAALELSRQGVLEAAIKSGETGAAADGERLDYTPAQAMQMRPLYEVAASEPSFVLAAGAICIWQLSIALAEEMYYRGFVQSAGVLALSWPVRASGLEHVEPLFAAFIEGLPLVVSSAVFGLVHAEFVEGAGAPPEGGDSIGDSAAAPPTSADGVVDTKAYWFRATAVYGALYAMLYIVSGHRVLAPTCAHAGLNIGLCLRDWGRMRRTPGSALRRVFSLGVGRDTFGLD